MLLPIVLILSALSFQIFDEAIELSSTHMRDMMANRDDILVEYPRVLHCDDKVESQAGNAGKDLNFGTGFFNRHLLPKQAPRLAQRSSS